MKTSSTRSLVAFWACSVDSRPVKPEQDGDAVLIPLPRGGSRDRAFSVDIVYAQHTAPLRSHLPRSVRLRAPKTDIQTTYAATNLNSLISTFASGGLLAQAL